MSIAESSRQHSPVTAWVLSAKTASALAARASLLQRFVEHHPEADVRDVAYALVAARTPLGHRAVAVGTDHAELLRGLAAIASSVPAPNVSVGEATATGRTVFVFPGLGSQWRGMALELLDSAQAFTDQMRECDAAFAELVDWSLLGVLRGDVGAPSLSRVDVLQPVLFAVMVSLARQWQAMGIHPDAVLGDSQGEIAAAYTAGVFSLRDAATVVVEQSKAIRSIADAAALVKVSARCERNDLPGKRIRVDLALDSAQIEGLREEMRASLSALQPQSCEVDFISTVTGARLDTSILDGDYWFANLRQPVLLEQAVRWSSQHGYRCFIESSPEPVLAASIEQTLDDCGSDHCVVGTLRRSEGGMRRFLLSAAEAHVRGTSPDWVSMFDDAADSIPF